MKRVFWTSVSLLSLCAVLWAATLATDAFTRGDSADLGTNWDVQTGQAQWRINGANNRATPDSLGSDAAENYNAVTWPNNQYSQAKITVTSTAGGGVGAGVACRMSTSANTFYRVVVDHAASSNVTLERAVAGTFTGLTTRTTTWVDADMLRLEVTGAGAGIVLKIFQNGSQLGVNFSDASGGIDSGRAGIAYSSTVTSCSLDDWEGGSVIGAFPSYYYQQLSGN